MKYLRCLFVSVALCQSALAQEEGLLGFWSFDEGAGTESADLSGNLGPVVFVEDEGTTTVPTWVDGQTGSALHFDGMSYAKISDFYGVGGSTPRTVAFWMKTDWQIDNGGNQAMVGFGINESGRRWHFKFEHTTQSIRTENQSGQNFGSDIVVTDGEWHHVASVLPAGGSTIGDVILYVDGVALDVNGNGAQEIDTSIDPDEGALEVTLGMGFLNTTYRFSVFTMDELGIWERGLSADEIKSLVDGARPISEGDPNLVTTSRTSLGQVTAVPPTHDGSFVVRNLGEANPLEISAIDVQGLNPDRFIIVDFPAAVAPGETAEVTYRFDSKGETGGFQAEFVIKNNEEGSPEVVVGVSASVINLSGPIAHYRLNEAADTEVINDASGWNRHGGVTAGVQLGQESLVGGDGSAVRVAGGDQVSVPSTLFDPFESFTISAWLKPDAIAGTQTLVAFGTDTPDFAVLGADDTIGWFVNGDFSTATGSVLVAGESTHVAVTFASDRLVIYVNGVEVLNEADPDPIDFSEDPASVLSLGSVNGNLPYAGLIDEVQIYNRPIAADDVKILFDNPTKTLGDVLPVDSDGDGLTDEEEVNTHMTDPLVVDTDNDELSDFEEVNNDPSTNPTLADTDGDGFNDGFEVVEGSDPNDAADFPADTLGKPAFAFNEIGDQATFDNIGGGLDKRDVSFRVWIDFEPAAVDDTEREMIWESGGGTVGISLVYETGNKLVLRAAGNGGNTVTTVEHVLTANELAAGELPVIWTFDVDNGDAATGQTIALYVGDVLVGQAAGDLDPDWTGANGAAFGSASASFAAGGENTVLDNGVEFASGTINLEKGLQMYPERLFTATMTPVDPKPQPGNLEIVSAQRTANGMELRWSGSDGVTVTVEYSLDLTSWAAIASDVSATSFEDSDAGRTGGTEAYYRVVIP